MKDKRRRWRHICLQLAWPFSSSLLGALCWGAEAGVHVLLVSCVLCECWSRELLNKMSRLLSFWCFLHFLNPDQRIYFFFLWKLNASLHFGLFTNNVLKIISLLINAYQRGLCGQDPQPAQTSGLHCLSWSCTPAEGLVWNMNLPTSLVVHMNHSPTHAKSANTWPLYNDRVHSQVSHAQPHCIMYPDVWSQTVDICLHQATFHS